MTTGAIVACRSVPARWNDLCVKPDTERSANDQSGKQGRPIPGT